jgi:hypothetical protein
MVERISTKKNIKRKEPAPKTARVPAKSKSKKNSDMADGVWFVIVDPVLVMIKVM